MQKSLSTAEESLIEDVLLKNLKILHRRTPAIIRGLSAAYPQPIRSLSAAYSVDTIHGLSAKRPDSHLDDHLMC